MDSSPSRSQFGPLAGLGLGHLIGLESDPALLLHLKGGGVDQFDALRPLPARCSRGAAAVV